MCPSSDMRVNINGVNVTDVGGSRVGGSSFINGVSSGNSGIVAGGSVSAGRVINVGTGTIHGNVYGCVTVTGDGVMTVNGNGISVNGVTQGAIPDRGNFRVTLHKSDQTQQVLTLDRPIDIEIREMRPGSRIDKLTSSVGHIVIDGADVELIDSVSGWVSVAMDVPHVDTVSGDITARQVTAGNSVSGDAKVQYPNMTLPQQQTSGTTTCSGSDVLSFKSQDSFTVRINSETHSNVVSMAVEATCNVYTLNSLPKLRVYCTHVGTVKNTSGSIKATSSAAKVKTVSGDVYVGGAVERAHTVSGDIMTGVIDKFKSVSGRRR